MFNEHGVAETHINVRAVSNFVCNLSVVVLAIYIAYEFLFPFSHRRLIHTNIARLSVLRTCLVLTRFLW